MLVSYGFALLPLAVTYRVYLPLGVISCQETVTPTSKLLSFELAGICIPDSVAVSPGVLVVLILTSVITYKDLENFLPFFCFSVSS